MLWSAFRLFMVILTAAVDYGWRERKADQRTLLHLLRLGFGIIVHLTCAVDRIAAK